MRFFIRDTGKRPMSRRNHWKNRMSQEVENRGSLLSVPDIFGWGRGLPREGVGAKKSVCHSKPRETKLFGGISRDFLPGYPGGARKIWEQKSLCSILVPNKKAKWIEETLRPFSAELPKSDSDTCLGRFDSDFGGPSGCNSAFRAVALTFVL